MHLYSVSQWIMPELYNWKPIGLKKKERKKIELLSTIKEWKKRTIQIKCIPPLWKERKVACSNPKLLVKFNFTILIKQNEDPNSHTTNSNNNMYMMLPTMFMDDLSLLWSRLLPKSSMASFPSGVRIKFPGWGSAWKRPVSSSCHSNELQKFDRKVSS